MACSSVYFSDLVQGQGRLLLFLGTANGLFLNLVVPAHLSLEVAGVSTDIIALGFQNKIYYGTKKILSIDFKICAGKTYVSPC